MTIAKAAASRVDAPVEDVRAPHHLAGWRIDHSTLKPVITDLEAFREEFSQDPAREAIEDLWQGRTLQAEKRLEALVLQHPDIIRYRALLADAHRDQGLLDLAISEYRTLLDETRGTESEPVMLQHLGKALFAGERYGEALMMFSRAYELRVVAGAATELVDSSMHAISRTHYMLRSQQES